MKQVDEDLAIMIDNRSEEIAEIVFFQEKQYGKVDEAMMDMEILMLIQDVYKEHGSIKTADFIRKKIYAFVEVKNRKFTLSALN